MRSALLLTALAAAGCVTTGPGRHDWRVSDPDRDRVHTAISPTMEPSFERHIRSDGRVADPFGSFSGSSCGSGEAYWGTTFGYRTPAGAARDVSPAEGRQILTGVRADVLAAVEKTGVNVTWAPAVEVGDGPNPEGKFVIYYTRKLGNASGEVSGELIGKLIPCPGPAPRCRRCASPSASGPVGSRSDESPASRPGFRTHLTLLVALGLAQRGLGRGQAGDRHPERGAAHVVHARRCGRRRRCPGRRRARRRCRPSGAAPCFALRLSRPFLMPISISWPTPSTSIDWNGSIGRILSFR